MQFRRMREQNLDRRLQIIAPTSPSSGSFSSCCGDSGSHVSRLALGAPYCVSSGWNLDQVSVIRSSWSTVAVIASSVAGRVGRWYRV
jgi:hypothetical protein